MKVTDKEDQAFRMSSQSDTFLYTGNEHVAMETADDVHSIPQFSEEIASDELINIGPEDGNSNMKVISDHELESYNDTEINLNAKEHKKQTVVQLEEQITEVVPQEEQVPEVCVRMRNSYVKSSFTCDSSVEMDDEDKKLREYWTHALQTSKSSGEIVEEIVKVMKNHQKTHDLMCPVCGSCVTRTIILRKRKRSNLISVERWYPDSLVQESERQPEITEENDSLPQYNGEDKEMETQDNEQFTEAYGCLTCFSLFFEKG